MILHSNVIFCLVLFVHLTFGITYEQTISGISAKTSNSKGLGSPWTLNTLCIDSTQTFLNNQKSTILQVSDFGFTLPEDSKVNNISVFIEHSKYPWSLNSDFSLVALTCHDGEFRTENIVSLWDRTINFNTFPRPGFTWNKSEWETKEIHHPSFGVRIQVSGSGFPSIGCVTISVSFESEELLPQPAPHSMYERSAYKSGPATSGSTPDTSLPAATSPSASPSSSLSANPSTSPTASPTSTPSSTPTPSPVYPSLSPSSSATSAPSNTPSIPASPGASSSATSSPDGGPSKKSGSSNVGLIAGIVAAIVVSAVALIVGSVLFVKKRKTENSDNETNLELNNSKPANAESNTNNKNSTAEPHYVSMRQSHNTSNNYEPLKMHSDSIVRTNNDTKSLNYTVNYSELTLEKEVGRGGKVVFIISDRTKAFGVVYKAKWRSNEVAVKKLITEEMTEKQIDEFVHEMALMKSLRPSPNVVLLLGICETPLCVITEYCAKGSLLRLLQSNETITGEQVRKIIKGIASGMLHLHFEGIVHRDLAARNVLLTVDMEPKISDFGLSRALLAQENSAKTTSNVGPLKWMAPECVVNREYGTPSDVWAFGITLIEIFTRSPPYLQQDALAVATRVATGELVPEIPENTPPAVAELMKGCFAYQASDRPTFQQICDKLE